MSDFTVVSSPVRKPRQWPQNAPGRTKAFGTRNSTKTKKRRKKGTITKLKEELWQLCRQIVFKTYGTDCYTCEAKNLEGSNCQGGHMPWHSSELAECLKRDPRFVRAQCFNCNMRKGGKGGTAYLRMEKEGIDVKALWAENLAAKGKVCPTQWFRDEIERYKQILESL